MVANPLPGHFGLYFKGRNSDSEYGLRRMAAYSLHRELTNDYLQLFMQRTADVSGRSSTIKPFRFGIMIAGMVPALI